jgi:hypothetical protein
MDTAASEAARALSAARWGNQKPVRLARELAGRAGQLPEAEREALRAALDEPGKQLEEDDQ